MMQKWEHTRWSKTFFNLQLALSIRGEKADLIDHISVDGWELVGVDEDHAYFKRPLVESEVPVEPQREEPWRNPLTGSFKFEKKDLPNAWAKNQARKAAEAERAALTTKIVMEGLCSMDTCVFCKPYR